MLGSLTQVNVFKVSCLILNPEVELYGTSEIIVNRSSNQQL